MKQFWPRITIVTPSYQQGKFLRATLESIHRQNYPNLEHLVMDGGSTDETLSILQAYRPRVQWWSKRDRGQVDALNQGFARATGEILGFLNADDLLAPGSLWEVARVFQQHPTVAWVTGEYQVIDQFGRPIQPWMVWYKRWQRQLGLWFPPLFPILLSLNNPVSQPSTFWRRTVGERAGKLQEAYPLAFDYEWWWRLYRVVGTPYVSPFTWSSFRVHEESKGGRQFTERLHEQWQVASDTVHSRVLLTLHRFHNQVASLLYRWLMY